MSVTLLLNATYEPLRIVPLSRAIGLVMTGKAEVLEESDEEVHRRFGRAPTVIRLKYFVRVPYRAKLPLTRRNLIARDHGHCAYCTNVGRTIDHVVPRSRGGQHTWENVVLACNKCNEAKGNQTLAELGWSLGFTPGQPRGLVWYTIGLTELNPAWSAYIPSPA